MRKGSGVWVWVCTASRKEKACSVYKKNKVERGCVVATVVARAAPGGAVRESSGVWVCTASRKEKACKKNKAERGCEKNPQKRTPAGLLLVPIRLGCRACLCCAAAASPSGHYCDQSTGPGPRPLTS